MSPRASLLLLALALVCTGGAFGSAAHAEEAAPAGRESRAAKQLYRQAVDAYAQARYEDAIALFLRADELGPSPAHSYNIARANEALNKNAEAQKWYRDYLRRADPAPDAAAVKQRIAHLQADARRNERQVVAIGASTPAPAAAKSSAEANAGVPVVAYHSGAPASVRYVAPNAVKPAPAADSGASVDPERVSTQATHSSTPIAKTLGTVALISGGAALAGSLVFEILRRDAESDANASKVQIDYADKIDTMESHQLVSRVLLGSGAGLALVGTLLWIAAPSSDVDSEETRFAVNCNLRGCGINASGRY